MTISTEGIIFTHTRYGDSSAIIHIYTKEVGMVSFMVNGVFGRKKRSNFQLLQPLNIVQLEFINRANRDIQRIRDFKVIHPMMRIPFSQSRRAQAFLLTEIYSRVLRNEGQNETIFNFLKEGIIRLDSDVDGVENLHIWLLFHSVSHLGFEPHNNYEEDCTIFDIMDGCFVPSEPGHPYILVDEDAKMINNLFKTTVDELKNVATNVHQRRVLLNAIIKYYELHHQSIGKISSLAILEELFRG